MAERTKLLYDQMAEPKYVLAMGRARTAAGCSSAATRWSRAWTRSSRWMSRARLPARPEALTEGLMRIQDIMMSERWWSEKRRPQSGAK